MEVAVEDYLVLRSIGQVGSFLLRGYGEERGDRLLLLPFFFDDILEISEELLPLVGLGHVHSIDG